jgi:hypothetical protein
MEALRSLHLVGDKDNSPTHLTPSHSHGMGRDLILAALLRAVHFFQGRDKVLCVREFIYKIFEEVFQPPIGTMEGPLRFIRAPQNGSRGIISFGN